jgi:hypothetical protein
VRFNSAFGQRGVKFFLVFWFSWPPVNLSNTYLRGLRGKEPTRSMVRLQRCAELIRHACGLQECKCSLGLCVYCIKVILHVVC